MIGTDIAYPVPTTDEPDFEEIMDMAAEEEYLATDGCGGIEADGECVHGHVSWLVYLGWI